MTKRNTLVYKDKPCVYHQFCTSNCANGDKTGGSPIKLEH